MGKRILTVLSGIIAALQSVMCSVDNPGIGLFSDDAEERLSLSVSLPEDSKGSVRSGFPDFIGFGYEYSERPGRCNWFSNELFEKRGLLYLSTNPVAAPRQNTKRIVAVGPSSVFNERCSDWSADETITFKYESPVRGEEQNDLLVADSGAVPLSDNIGLHFEHILGCLQFVAGGGLPECTIKSISISGVALRGLFDSGRGWSSVSETGTVAVDSDISISDSGCRGSLLHSEDASLMLIPQTLGASSELSLKVVSNGKEYDFRTSLSGLSITAGDITALSLEFSILENSLRIFRESCELDISSEIKAGYDVVDIFLVNGGQGGQGGSKTGFVGADGINGNFLLVSPLYIDESCTLLNLNIGAGGRGGDSQELRDGDMGDGGGVTSVSYGNRVFTAPFNVKNTPVAVNPFDDEDETPYGKGGRGGSKQYGSTMPELAGKRGESGAVILRFRVSSAECRIIGLKVGTMTCRKNLLIWNASAYFNGEALSSTVRDCKVHEDETCSLTIPITTSGVGVWSALYSINVYLTDDAGNSFLLGTATYNNKTLAFEDFSSIPAGNYTISIDLK